MDIAKSCSNKLCTLVLGTCAFPSSDCTYWFSQDLNSVLSGFQVLPNHPTLWVLSGFQVLPNHPTLWANLSGFQILPSHPTLWALSGFQILPSHSTLLAKVINSHPGRDL